MVRADSDALHHPEWHEHRRHLMPVRAGIPHCEDDPLWRYSHYVTEIERLAIGQLELNMRKVLLW